MLHEGREVKGKGEKRNHVITKKGAKTGALLGRMKGGGGRSRRSRTVETPGDQPHEPQKGWVKSGSGRNGPRPSTHGEPVRDPRFKKRVASVRGELRGTGEEGRIGGESARKRETASASLKGNSGLEKECDGDRTPLRSREKRVKILWKLDANPGE